MSHAEKDPEHTVDVLLVQPNVIWVYDPFEHLGLAYLAASLRRAGLRVAILDGVLERLTTEELCRRILSYDFQILGMTLISHGYRATVRMLDYIRAVRPEVSIVGGGHFATFAATKIMDDTQVFDAIAIGEADNNFVAYCQQQVRREALTAPGFLYRDGRNLCGTSVIDMDALPFPARDMLPLAMERGAQVSVASSRGCYARCTFCTVHSFYQRIDGKRWFGRSIPNILEELRGLHEQFGISHFNFVDDNFVGAGQAGRLRILEFAESYKKSGLPMTFHIDCRASDVNEEMIDALIDAGLTSIFLGIESVSRQDLIDYRKGLKVEANWNAVKILKSRNVPYTLAMIMFNPRTTASSIIDNVNFLKDVEYYPRNPISILNIYEGTDLYSIYRDFVSGPFWNYKFRFEHDLTAAIHKASMQFIKDSLPLERILSLSGPASATPRLKLNKIRLFALGALAEQMPGRSPDQILTPWRKAMDELRLGVASDVAQNARAARFGQERLYIQIEPQDALN
jgi:anaerobic magnesium-protoporphyrin IX monomethyl ester cyclase